jgi:hypothetical protein
MSADVGLTLGAQEIELVGTGTEDGTDGASPVQVTMTIGKNSITSTAIDN